MPKRVKNETVQNDRRAFTLIELLVVIAIIGLLSSVVLSSLNVAREKGAEATHIQDVKSVKTALLLYYETYGYYPPGSQGAPGDPACDGAPSSFTGSFNLDSTVKYCLEPNKFISAQPSTVGGVPDFYIPAYTSSSGSGPYNSYFLWVFDPTLQPHGGWCVTGLMNSFTYQTLYSTYPVCNY